MSVAYKDRNQVSRSRTSPFMYQTRATNCSGVTWQPCLVVAGVASAKQTVIWHQGTTPLLESDEVNIKKNMYEGIRKEFIVTNFIRTWFSKLHTIYAHVFKSRTVRKYLSLSIICDYVLALLRWQNILLRWLLGSFELIYWTKICKVMSW